MFAGFQMRNRFRERLVMGLKEKGYHGKKAGKVGVSEGMLGGLMLWPQEVCKRAASEWVHWEQRDAEAGLRG